MMRFLWSIELTILSYIIDKIVALGQRINNRQFELVTKIELSVLGEPNKREPWRPDPMYVLIWIMIPVIFFSLIFWGVTRARAETTVPPACIEAERAPSEGVFDDCVNKMKQLENTNATSESKARFFWNCGYQAGIRRK